MKVETLGLLKKTSAFVVIVTSIIALCLYNSFSLPAPPKALATDFYLADVTVINPMLSRDHVDTILVGDGKVQAINEDSVSATMLDRFRGSYVLPGFVNMHDHNPADNALNLSPLFSLLNIAHGVTTVRDAADTDGTAVPLLRAQLAEGRWPTPNLYSCGGVVTTGKTRWPNSIVLSSPADAAQAIEKLKSAGHSCVKSYENLTAEMIGAVKSSARHAGLQVIGHVPNRLRYEQASLPDTQHFFGVPTIYQQGVIQRNGDWRTVDDKRLNDLVSFISNKDLINTPTLVTLLKLQEYGDYSSALKKQEFQLLPPFYAGLVWHPEKGIPVYRNLSDETLDLAKQTLAKKMRLLKSLHDAKARLNLGTDTQQPFVVPGVSYWSEIKLFNDAGIPLEEVLAYATWRAAQQFSGSWNGKVEKGQQANFLIFKDDPTETTQALESLQAVVVRGRLYEKEALDEAIARMKQHYNSWPLKPISFFFAEKAMQKIAKNFTH
jgi:hypothetical protein